MRRAVPLVVLAVVVLSFLLAYHFVLGSGHESSPDSAKTTNHATPTAPAQPDAATTAPVAPAGAERSEVATTPAAAPRNGRFGARGVVLFAADRTPAAGAIVRAFHGDAPLTAIAVRDRMRHVGKDRAPAASHDLDGMFENSGGNDDAKDDGSDPSSDGHRVDGVPLAQTTCDASGRFELLGLEDGVFTLDAVLPHAAPAESKQLAPTDPPIAEGVELTLVAGATVRGRVVTPAASPIADAEVTLATPFDPYSVFSANGIAMRSPAIVRSGADGTFEFLGVPAPLDLQLVARARGHARSKNTSVSTTVASADGPADLPPVELVLPDGATLDVQVVDDAGQPIAAARCRVQPGSLKLDEIASDAKTLRGGGRRTDATGHVRFDGVAIGRWRVSAEVPHLVGAPKTVDVAAATTMPVTLRLAHGATVRGKVHAKDGTPIGGARVAVFPEPGLLNLSESILRENRRETKSGDDGAFVVDGLPAGKLSLEANAKGYQPKTQSAEPGDTPVDVELATRGALEGVVISKKSGRPLDHFDLTVARKKSLGTNYLEMGANMAALADVTLPFATPNGKFRVTGVVPGTLRVVVRAPEHGELATDWIELGEGDTKRGLVLLLEPEAVIEGVVVAAEGGAPIAGVEVRRDLGGGLLESILPSANAAAATSDVEGHFRLGGLAAGKHRLVASHAGFVETAAGELEVAAGQTLGGVRIELAKGGEIWGVVAGPDGAPVASAAVIANDVSRMKLHSAKCDRRGEYHLTALAAGSYTVSRLPQSFDFSSSQSLAEMQNSVQTRNVRLAAAEVARVDFEAVQAGRATLAGRVVQARRPYPHAFVAVMVHSPDSATATTPAHTAVTGEDGTFRIAGLEPGPAFVQVHESDLGTRGGANAAVRTVTLVEDETTNVELEIPAGSLVGKVVDAASGAPLGGVPVYAISDASGGSNYEAAVRRMTPAHSDATGHFEVKNLTSGTHRLVVGGGDLLSSGVPDHSIVKRDGVTVGDAGATDVGTIPLPAAARIEGVVTDSAGKPQGRATVFLRDPATGEFLEEWTSTSSDDSGHFEYGAVPNGTWDVVCRAPGLATAVVRGVVAREGTTTSVRVKLVGGTEVFVDLSGSGAIDLEKLLTLRVEVDGPQGRVPFTLFGMGDLQELMQRPPRLDVVRVGRFGPGEYHVRGRFGEQSFDKTIKLDGEPELHVPLEWK